VRLRSASASGCWRARAEVGAVAAPWATLQQPCNPATAAPGRGIDRIEGCEWRAGSTLCVGRCLPPEDLRPGSSLPRKGGRAPATARDVQSRQQGADARDLHSQTRSAAADPRDGDEAGHRQRTAAFLGSEEVEASVVLLDRQHLEARERCLGCVAANCVRAHDGSGARGVLADHPDRQAVQHAKPVVTALGVARV
jgi:hypothetical protein